MINKDLMRLVVLLMILISIPSFGQNDSLKVSILTVSEGDAVSSLFGHTAIRIRDLNNNTDRVYNFGLFDFDTPLFSYKFLAGKLQYKVATHDYFGFISRYALEKRVIYEQHLQLQAAVKKRIQDTLEYLIKPENKYYHYEFFEKNCTSQIRDILFRNLNVTATLKEKQGKITYRDMLVEYLKLRPWYRFAIHLIIGQFVDKKIDGIQAMALPKYFMQGLDDMRVSGRSIVTKEDRITNYNLPAYLLNNLFAPFIVFFLFLVLYLKFPKIGIDKAFILFISAIGLFISVLSLITNHVELQHNWDLLWAHPLYIIFLFNSYLNSKHIKNIAIVFLVLIVDRIIIGILGIQYIPLSYYPLLATLIVILWRYQREARNTSNLIS